jgi:hypothetical protein
MTGRGPIPLSSTKQKESLKLTNVLPRGKRLHLDHQFKEVVQYFVLPLLRI